MRSPSRTLLLIAAATALSGCAPYIGSCSWVVPEAGPALMVVEARKPTAGECNCLNCRAPGRFVIQRDGYTLEFWNGDRWYAEVYMRARTKDGTILALSSDSSEFLRIAPHVPAESTHGFEYFMRMKSEDGKGFVRSLHLTVVDAEGRVLGAEDISLRVETRKDVSIEYI